MNEQGKKIPGLYAARRTAVGVCSNICQRMSVADCVCAGRYAARSIVQLARRASTKIFFVSFSLATAASRTSDDLTAHIPWGNLVEPFLQHVLDPDHRTIKAAFQQARIAMHQRSQRRSLS